MRLESRGEFVVQFVRVHRDDVARRYLKNDLACAGSGRERVPSFWRSSWFGV